MKDRMSDDQMYRILNDFAKDHPLADGLEVSVHPGGMSFKTVDTVVGGKYEFSHLLSEYINGALQLLMWARRANRVRFKHLKKGHKTR